MWQWGKCGLSGGAERKSFWGKPSTSWGQQAESSKGLESEGCSVLLYLCPGMGMLKVRMRSLAQPYFFPVLGP